MRITQTGLTERIVEQVRQRYARLSEAQQRVTTGRAVELPSDNPSAAGEILSLNSRLARAERYERNAQAALSELNATESSLAILSDLLTRVRAAAVRGANSATGEEGRAALAKQIDSEIDEALRIANERSGNRYLFGGNRASSTPYQAERDEAGQVVGVSRTEDEDPMELEITVGDGQRLETGIVAGDLFELPDGQNLFDVLIKLRDALKVNDIGSIDTALTHIDAALNLATDMTSLVGARAARAQSIIEKLTNYRNNTANRLSELVDVDVLEAVTQFNSEQTAYEMSLRAAAKIIQPSLVNFID